MSKIIIITPSKTYGGAEVQSKLLQEILQEEKEVKLLAKDEIRVAKSIILRKVLINVIYLIKISKYCMSNNVEFVISFLPQSHIFSIYAKVISQSKLITAIRNDLRYCRSSLEDAYRWNFDILSYFTDVFTVQTDEMKRFIRWRINYQKSVKVIPNILDLYDNYVGKYEDNIIVRKGVIIVQRMSHQKDPIYMIELCKSIQPSIPIDIFGDGPYLRLVKESLKENENITIHGHATKEVVIKMMKNKKIGILTSYYEGMPNVITEYVQNGCLPISTYNEYHYKLTNIYHNTLKIGGVDPENDSKIINTSYNLPASNIKKIQANLMDKLLQIHSKKEILSSWINLLD